MQITKVGKKIVISGKIIEVYDYEKPYLTGYKTKKNKSNKKYKDVVDKDGLEKRNDNQYRSKKKVRRLVNTNITKDFKFIGLTYKIEPEDRKKIKHDFKKFVQRLKWELKKDIKYIAVIENGGKNNRLHIHMIIFEIDYIPNKKLRDIWSLGWVKINRKSIDNMGAYISKYITKQMAENDFEKNSYMRSKGLKEPIELINEDAEDYEKRLVDLDPVYENTYSVKNGDLKMSETVEYKQYNMLRK